MPLESLACNNCGAPLQVPPTANYVQCNHCGAQLAIHRESSVSYTEKIGQIDERTERMARQLAELRYHQALASIDRDWDREREKYLVTSKHGVRREPSVVGGVIGGAVFTLAGVLILINASPFGLLVVALGIGAAIYGVVKAELYKGAERAYRMRRSRVSLADFEEALDRPTAAFGTPAGSQTAEQESSTWPGDFDIPNER